MAEIPFQPTTHQLTINPKAAGCKGTSGSLILSILRVKDAAGNSNNLNILSGVLSYANFFPGKRNSNLDLNPTQLSGINECSLQVTIHMVALCHHHTSIQRHLKSEGTLVQTKCGPPSAFNLLCAGIRHRFS